MTVQVTGLAEAMKVIDQMGQRAPQGAATLLKDFADTRVVAPAKRMVPRDTGTLADTIQSSAPVISETQVSVSVSAGGPFVPYALKVHENPRAGKTGGLSPSGKKYKRWATVGQWKYLEIPALDAAKNSAGWLAEEARILLRKMRG